jgi:hypothetical protein
MSAFRLTDRHALWVGLVLFFVSGVAFAWQHSPERRDGGRGPAIGGDGRYFYLVLRSWTLDRDFDFTNDYAQYGNGYALGKSKTGKPANPFGIGPAVAWLPFFVVGHAASVTAAALGLPVATDGMGRIDQTATLCGSFLYASGAVLFSYLLARRWFSPAASLLSATSAWLSGPLPWYQIWECSYAHAMEAGFAAAFLYVWSSPRSVDSTHSTVRHSALVGALLGFLILMRPQQAVFAVFILGDCFDERSHKLSRMAVAFATAALVFIPQMLMWHSVYGRLLLTPQGSGFLRLGESMWMETLFASRNGLFFWAPLWACGVLGLLWCRPARRFAWLALLVFALAAWINGAAWDWWAGGAYGGRRFCAFLPVCTVGLAALSERILSRRVPAALMLATVGLVLVAQLSFLRLYERSTFARLTISDSPARIPWDEPLPTRLTWGQVVPLGPVFDVVGNPVSWPASVPFALRYHVSPAKYDVLVGPYLLDERLPTTNPRRIGQREERIDVATSRFRIAAHRWLLPINRTGRLDVRLEGVGWGAIVWNGRRFGEGALPLAIELPRDAIRRGLNDVTLEGNDVRTLLLQETSDWPPAWATSDAP